jgi:hypothetical protein
VADPEITLEGRERRLVEDLRHEAELLVDEEVLPVRNRDARRFLAAVLLGEEAEVGKAGDFLMGCPHPEEAAFLSWTFAAHCWARW